MVGLRLTTVSVCLELGLGYGQGLPRAIVLPSVRIVQLPRFAHD